MLIRLIFVFLVVTLQPVYAQTAPSQVAIIIDDIGFQKADPHLIKLPYALTFAVMPYTPNGVEMAVLAKRLGKEVMLHMPMEAVAQNHLLGKGALRQSMSRTEVEQALTLALKQIPQAVGVNNHMGSLYTTLAEPMDWTMQFMSARGLYFIDSKTTGRSQVGKYTQLHQVKSRSRDVFLDNDKSYKALDKQFNQLIAIAKQHGSAIAIGHPYPETYQYLRKNLHRLKQSGIQLVPASHLLDLPAPAAFARQVTPTTSKPQSSNPTKKLANSKIPTDNTANKTAPQQVITNDNNNVAQPEKTPAMVEAPVQVLTAETEVQPLELLPWHLPLRLDLPGFAAPSSPLTLYSPMSYFLVVEQAPLVTTEIALPAVGVLQY